MNNNTRPYHVIDFPAERRDLPFVNEINSRRHFMYSLLEVDVTVARRFIEDYRRQTGELLSFTGYLAFCLARAVDEDKAVQAYMKGRKKLVIFENVDVGIMIEKKIGERYAPMGHVIRDANHKTYQEIHQEIRTAQSKPVQPSRGMEKWLSSAMSLPWPLSGLFSALFRAAIRRDPTISASIIGTVGITSIGMFNKGHGGWGFAPIIYGLGVIVGGTARKPAEVEGRIELREILNLTVMFDHDVIDGAPAARFTQRLVELIECGDGLYETDGR